MSSGPSPEGDDAPRPKPKPPPRKLPAELVCPHSTEAFPYTVFNICWKDRIKKERTAEMNFLPPKAPPQPLSLKELESSLRKREFYPIGGHNLFNNNSKVVAKTFGLGTWDASGGVKSMHRAQFGGPRTHAQSKSEFRPSASLPLFNQPRPPSLAE